MNKSLILVVGMALGTTSMFSSVSAQDVTSLRGNNNPADRSNEVIVKQVHRDQEPIARDFVQQPPLIPHDTEGYTINLKFNKCLTCHSWVNYKKANATKVSQTHFSDRQENVLANVSPRRYFCTQCHVPQADTRPLVENEFRPLQAIR